MESLTFTATVYQFAKISLSRKKILLFDGIVSANTAENCTR